MTINYQSKHRYTKCTPILHIHKLIIIPEDLKSLNNQLTTGKERTKQGFLHVVVLLKMIIAKSSLGIKRKQFRIILGI